MSTERLLEVDEGPLQQRTIVRVLPARRRPRQPSRQRRAI